MAQTTHTGPKLTSNARALQKALMQSADRAQLLAQAFGKVVPAEKRKKATINVNTHDRTTQLSY